MFTSDLEAYEPLLLRLCRGRSCILLCLNDILRIIFETHSNLNKSTVSFCRRHMHLQVPNFTMAPFIERKGEAQKPDEATFTNSFGIKKVTNNSSKHSMNLPITGCLWYPTYSEKSYLLDSQGFIYFTVCWWGSSISIVEWYQRHELELNLILFFPIRIIS